MKYIMPTLQGFQPRPDRMSTTDAYVKCGCSIGERNVHSELPVTRSAIGTKEIKEESMTSRYTCHSSLYLLKMLHRFIHLYGSEIHAGVQLRDSSYLDNIGPDEISRSHTPRRVLIKDTITLSPRPCSLWGIW